MNFKQSLLHSVLFSVIYGTSVWTNQPNCQELVNHPAPEFSAPALYTDGTVDILYLHDFAGQKVILYFYPMDNTPGCTKQAKNFRDNIAKLKKLGIILIGISCDSIKSHKKFQKKYNLPYILVSDSRWKKTIAKLYGAAGLVYSNRKTFLIDEKGVLFKAFDKVNIAEQVDDIVAAFARHTAK